MAFGNQILLYGLLIANALFYALLILGLFKRRSSRPVVSNVAEAFALLETALKESLPDLHEGFTWREAISRVEGISPEVNWESLQNVLKGYEAFRYGGFELVYTDPGEVLRLASALGKGARFVSGS